MDAGLLRTKIILMLAVSGSIHLFNVYIITYDTSDSQFVQCADSLIVFTPLRKGEE